MDALREGTVPAVIRRKGALGHLPVPLPEKIEILILLSQDEDEETRNTAFQTLLAWNVQELQLVLGDPTTSLTTLDFVASHVAPGRKELIEALLQNPGLPGDLRDSVQQASSASRGASAAPPAPSAAPGEGIAPEGNKKEQERETLLQRINRMSAAEKIKTALTGNQDERLVLIRDSNKVVARAVLQSPKLSDQEAENIASMKNVTEEVLRLIAMNRKFMKSYAVVRQLVNNPRTPIDVGLPLLNRLNERDLKGLMLNKNVAEVIRGMAQKMIKQREEAAKPKITIGKH